MKLILLINFINELLDMKEEELKKLHHYLEGLLNLNQGEEVELLMDEENEKNIVLPEINEEEIDYKEQEIKEDEATEEEIAETPKLIDELVEVKEELINFKDVLNEYQSLEPSQTGSFNLEITKNFLKGGDNKMPEEIENCECTTEIQAFGDPGCCGCEVPVIEYPETIEIDNEIEFCCVTCVPENFFDEDQLGATDIGEAELNYQLNKVDCCVEQRDVIDEFECEKRVCIGKAVGCIELGLVAFPLTDDNPPQRIPRESGNGSVIVCCNTCICVNNIISAVCEDQAACPCDDLEAEVTNLSVVDTPCGENVREVVFTGTVTLSTP